MLLFAAVAGKKTSIDDDHSRCLLFDAPLDLIGRHIKQTVFQTTFHIGMR